MAKRTRKINLNWRLIHSCPECGITMRPYPTSTKHSICDECNAIYKILRDGTVSYHGPYKPEERKRPQRKSLHSSPSFKMPSTYEMPDFPRDIAAVEKSMAKAVKKKAKKPKSPQRRISQRFDYED